LAGIVAVELGDRGIVGFNLHPGFVTTERILIDMAPFGFDGSTGAPPDVIGAAAAWLVTEPEARVLNGTWIEGQELCAERNLLPDWPA
jgi:NAD(P)-dependent dehydrogenase (short-subunit alcohol dehydrogenase family)